MPAYADDLYADPHTFRIIYTVGDYFFNAINKETFIFSR